MNASVCAIEGASLHEAVIPLFGGSKTAILEAG
jgi:hypothetical protein